MVSQVIPTLLNQSGVEKAEVEWQEAVTSRSIGPRLLRLVGTDHPTVHVRRHLTATLGIPLVATEMEVDDAQGTLGFCFHENRDKDGNPSMRRKGPSLLSRSFTRLSRSNGVISRSGILVTSIILHLSPSMSRVTGILRIGARSNLAKRSLRISSRVTWWILVRFDSAFSYYLFTLSNLI